MEEGVERNMEIHLAGLPIEAKIVSMASKKDIKIPENLSVEAYEARRSLYSELLDLAA